MPAQFNEQLDDEPTTDGCVSFVGGMYSNANARLLKPEQAAVITDSNVSVNGPLSSRHGTLQIGADVAASTSISGIGYYKTASDNYELAATDTGVYKLNGASWTQLGAQTFGSGQIDLVQGAVGVGVTIGDDNLHACGDGTDIFKWDGSAWTNLSSPETTNSAPRNASILCWHTGRLVAAGANIKTRTADTAVVPDGIYFSDILDPANWGAALGGGTYATQIRVGGGDGSEITSIVPWTQFSLAVFKRNSTFVVNADPTLAPSDMPIQSVHPTVGCVAKRSAVQVGSDIMFLAQDGIRSLNQTIASETQQNVSLPTSYPIQDYINRINWEHAGNAAATFWNNLYILAVPLGNSTNNNWIFVYNTLTTAWNGLWTNIPASCFAVRKSSERQSLMIGLSIDDKVIEYLDYVDDDDATDATYTDWHGEFVTPIVLTRAMTFGDPKAPKHGLDYELEWNNSKGAVDITPLLDEARDSVDPNDDTFTMASGGFAVPFDIPFDIPGAGIQRQMFDLFHRDRFRELQLEITMSGAGRKELRQLTVNAFLEPASPLLGNGVGGIPIS